MDDNGGDQNADMQIHLHIICSHTSEINATVSVLWLLLTVPWIALQC